MKKTQTTVFQKLQLLKRSIKQLRQATTHRKKSNLIFRIKRLFRQLDRWANFAKLKPGIVASMIALGFSFGPQSLDGQNFFGEPVTGAFGISPIEDEGIYLLMPSFADLDGDGDLDIVASSFAINYFEDVQKFFYYENKGDASIANFTGPKSDLFGLGINLGEEYIVLSPGTFVDLDNDGDFDILSTGTTYDPINEGVDAIFCFQENIGTKEDPSFADPVTNPFNLDFGNIQANFHTTSTVDLDEDGDMDIIVNMNYGSQILYFENTGSGENVSFNDPIDLSTTFLGLQNEYEAKVSNSFADMDNDGDQDLFVGIYAVDMITEDVSYFARYYENISDGEIKFKAPVDNPFNLMKSDDNFILPELVDIDADGDFDIFSFRNKEFGDNTLDLYFYENLGGPSFNLAETESTDCTQGQTITIDLLDINAGDANVNSLSIEATTDNETLVTNLTVDYQNPETDANVSFIPALNGTGTANIMVTISDGELNFTENYLFTVGDCVGIDDIEARSAFKLSPNPANDFVRITLEDELIAEDAFINIYDLSGQLLLQKALNKNTIDVSELVSGIYLLEVSQENINHYKKLIIEK